MNILRNKGWEIGAAVSLVIAMLAAAFMFSTPAHANPLRFPATAATAAATTTVTYMTAGTATTTLYYDAYANGGGSQAFDKAVLLTQLNASSTATTLRVSVEYSQGVPGVDCTATPNACDWFADSQLQSSTATTSQPYAIPTPISYQWIYASSTQGGAAGLGTASFGLRAITIPTPTRYTRVFYTLIAGSTNGSVWGMIVGQKQST